MGCLPNTVGAALDKGDDLRNDAIGRQCINTQPVHHLIVQQDNDNTHRQIRNRRWEPCFQNLSRPPERSGHPDELQGVFTTPVVEQHHQIRDIQTDRRGESRPKNPKVKDKYEEIVPDQIAGATEQHPFHGQAGISVIAKKRGLYAAEHAAGHGKPHRL